MISIIIPVYNVKKYLDECLLSVCNQTYKDLEIIIIDDGSTDGSGELCDRWKAKDDRVIVVHKPNGGISSARNAGLDIAKGDYVGFVDPDDRIELNMYECLHDEIVKTNCKMVVCAYRAIEEDGSPCKQIYKDIPKCKMNVDEYLINMNENIRKHCALTVVWNKLYKKELFENVRFEEGKTQEDEYLLNKILFQLKEIYFIDDALYIYIQHRNSIMHAEFSAERLHYYYALTERIQCIEQNKCSAECLESVVVECIDTGVRYWLLIKYLNILSSEKEFYENVLAVMKKYKVHRTILQRILWTLFAHLPSALATTYCTYKKIMK